MDLANVDQQLPTLLLWWLEVQLAATLLFSLTIVALRFLPRPAERVIVARVGLLAVFLTSAFLIAAPADMRLSLVAASSQTNQTAVAWGLLGWLGAIYAAGSLSVAAWLVLGRLQVTRLVRNCRPSDEWIHREATLLGADAQTLITTAKQPLAIGVWRPSILIPWSITKRADPLELRSALAHEWEHIRRGDLRLLMLVRGLTILLYANPLFWHLRRKVEQDQELLADAAGARATSCTQYAEHLLSWSQEAAQWHGPVLAAGGSRDALRKRIEAVLTPSASNNDSQTAPGKRALSAMCSGLILLAVACCSLTILPASRQNPLGDRIAVNPPAIGQIGKTASPDAAAELTQAASVNRLLFADRELVAVRQTGELESRWWRPDGSPLDCLPDDLESVTLENGLQLLFQHSDEANIGGIDNAALAAEPLRQLATDVVFDSGAADIRLGFSRARWTTHQTIDGSGSLACGGLSVSPCLDANHAVLTISDEDTDDAFRVLAIDECGTEYRPSSTSFDGQEWTIAFRDLPFDVVREFVIQSRPEATVELRDIALSPDQKTNAQVVTPAST